MYKKILTFIFCAAFLAMIGLPLIFTNLKDGVISSAENRALAPKASLTKEDGSLNTSFTDDFETWFDDNVGFRAPLVVANARIQYSLFRNIAQSDGALGPEGEFNYITDQILASYQRFDLPDAEETGTIVSAYETVRKYLADQGIAYYYFQCRDKQTIYPEQFPDTVIQYGEKSRTDILMENLAAGSSVRVIDPKQALTDGKAQYQTYSRYGNPAHWTHRGAYIGYLQLMDALNQDAGGRLRVLGENDYDLTLTDQGTDYFVGIHKKEMLEAFRILDPKAAEHSENLTLFQDDARSHYYINESAGNDMTVLILGDSYIYSYILDDLAESFRTTVFIMGEHTESLPELIEAYQPGIVISENAERAERSARIIRLADRIASQ